MFDRDPLYLFLCHLEWRNRHNLAAYNELVAALDDGEPAIRELAQDLIHSQARGQHAAKLLLRVTRKVMVVDVNSQPTLVASVKTGNPQHAMPHAVCKVNAHARFVRKREPRFIASVRGPGVQAHTASRPVERWLTPVNF